jgi:hypothetical protein
MKNSELSRSEGNGSARQTTGTHRATKKNGATPRKSGKTAAHINGKPEPDVAAEVLAAPFLGIEAEPVDAPMWAIHTAGWFQPEAAPSSPSWSGLQIERRHRIPAPGLLDFPVVPLDAAAVPDNRSEAVIQSASPTLPESGIEPLGWDPRAVYPRKEFT